MIQVSLSAAANQMNTLLSFGATMWPENYKPGTHGHSSKAENDAGESDGGILESGSISLTKRSRRSKIPDQRLLVAAQELEIHRQRRPRGKTARAITPDTPRIEKYDGIDMGVKLMKREGRTVHARRVKPM